MKFSFQSSTPTAITDKITDILQRIDRHEPVVESYVVLSNAKITDLNFGGSAMTYLTAVEVILDSCDFKTTNLSGLDYRGGEIHSASFESANLVKASMYACNLERVSFKHCNLARAEFVDVKFKEVTFEGASLIGTSFDNCDLRDVNFEFAVLDGTHFFGCILNETTKNLHGIVLK